MTFVRIACVENKEHERIREKLNTVNVFTSSMLRGRLRKVKIYTWTLNPYYKVLTDLLNNVLEYHDVKSCHK